MGVVIVTYNRLDMLKIALDCFDAQTYSPKYILIVDNASTDGTKEYLAGWVQAGSRFQKYVLTQDTNTGGSGGFYTGLESAARMDADWIWVSDDDAFPEPDALEQLNRFIEAGGRDNNDLAAVCCQVINDGKPDLSHRRTIVQKGIRVAEIRSTEQDYEKEYFEINNFSYVGALINREKLRMVGLTKKEYFIWYDDTEHALRLSKAGKIYCVPAAIVHHDVPSRKILTWKSYYGKRNKLDMIRCHFPGYVYTYYSLNLLARAFAARIIRGDIEKQNMYLKALKDCRSGRFGLDDTYKPGWQPDKTKGPRRSRNGEA